MIANSFSLTEQYTYCCNFYDRIKTFLCKPLQTFPFCDFCQGWLKPIHNKVGALQSAVQDLQQDVQTMVRGTTFFRTDVLYCVFYCVFFLYRLLECEFLDGRSVSEKSAVIFSFSLCRLMQKLCSLSTMSQSSVVDRIQEFSKGGEGAFWDLKQKVWKYLKGVCFIT